MQLHVLTLKIGTVPGPPALIQVSERDASLDKCEIVWVES